MDHRRRHHHHQNHHQQQHQRQLLNHEYTDSRYYHVRSPPPPPPPHLHPPLPPPPPPHRHLPPPPPPPLHHPPPPPPPSIPYSVHQPPLSPRSPPPPPSRHHHHHHPHPRHHDLNFVNSPPPPPPHHHHHQQCRHLPIDDDNDEYDRDRDPHHRLIRPPPFDFPPNNSPNSRVLPSSNRMLHHRLHDDDDVDHDRHLGFRFPEQPRVSPSVDDRLDWDRRMSPPPPFVEFDDRFRRTDLDSPSPRFRDEHRLQFRPNELLDRRRDDNRRIIDNVPRERLVEDEDPRLRHEQYHPEILLREFELNRGCSITDDISLRGSSRDDVLSREVSRSPMKYRNRGMKNLSYEEEVNRGGSESRRYADRGRREEMPRADYTHSSTNTPRKSLQKKSAFLRIQPPPPPPVKNTSFRNNKHDTTTTTPSPNKGKESLEFEDKRKGSPVELDVSFKSNGLVAKAVTVSDSDIRIDSESPSKAGRVKFRIKGKPSEKRAKISPIKKRVGLSSKVEVSGNNSEAFPSGLCDSTHNESHKGQILDKDDTTVSLGKVSSPNVRKKRKSVISLSRLSSSPVTTKTKTDDRLVNVDSSVDHPSGECVKQSTKELPSGEKAPGSVQNVKVVETLKFDLNEPASLVVEEEVAGHPVSEASFPEGMRKRGRSESPVSPGPLGLSVPEGPGNTNVCVQDIQRTSYSGEDATKFVDKCTSDMGADYDGNIKCLDLVSVLADNGSAASLSEPVVPVDDILDSIDIRCGNVDKGNSIAVANSNSSSVDVSIEKLDRVDLTCTDANFVKPCGSPVSLSPERAMIEQSYGDLHLDRDNNQAELNDSGDHAKNLRNSSSMDVSSDNTGTSLSNDDVVSTNSENLTTASDIRASNDIQDQQCRGADTTLLDEAGKESPKACVSMGGDSASLSLEEDISLLKRKRTAGTELVSVDSGRAESSYDDAVTAPVENLKFPADKLCSAVSGSRIDELDLHGNGLGYVEGMTFMNDGHNLDSIENHSISSKRRKILPLESDCSDVSASGNCCLPAWATSPDTLRSMAEELLNSVKYSIKSARQVGCSDSIHPDKNVVVGAMNSALPTKSSFADSAKADSVCLSVKEDVLSDEKQSSQLSEFGCKQENENLMMAGADDGIKFIALECKGRMTTNDQNVGEHHMVNDHTGDSDHGPLITGTECENNIAVYGNLSSRSDCPQLCAEPIFDQATTNCDMLDTLSNVGSPGATPTLDTSDAVPALNPMSDEKLDMNGKRLSEHVVMQDSVSFQTNPILESNETNLKPGTSAAVGDQSFVKKATLVPAKTVKNTMLSSYATNRQLIRKNVLTRVDASLSASHTSVTAPSNKALSTYPVKPRTWHRADNPPPSNILVKKPSVGPVRPQRPPINRALKVQGTSYIRKGNSLVRNPASGAATLAPRVVAAPINQSKSSDKNRIKQMVVSPGMTDSIVVSDCLVTAGRNNPIEMPRTPPLPCSGKASDCDTSGDCRTSPLVGQSERMDYEEALKSSETALISCGNPETVVDGNLEDRNAFSDGNLSGSNSKRITYIKRKSNQLIASSTPSQSSAHSVDKARALSSESSYFKRKKNQLIRASSESNIQQMVSVNDCSSNSQPQKGFGAYSASSSTKRRSNKVKSSKLSLVWKLGDTKPSGKDVEPLGCGKILSHLLPWKRVTYWRSVWQSSVNFSNSSTMIKTRKLLCSRKRAAIYVRSGRGFSLRRSKMISLAGSSLKWSKSMERRSKKVNEDASHALATMGSMKRLKAGAPGVISGAESGNHNLKLHPGERIFRIGVFRYRMDPSRRSLQRIPDDEQSDSAASQPAKDARKTYVPKRLLIGSDEYVRIGNGNQLVRDPKRRTRILASEKVRWSLHTARMRLAKKRKFCQFFTRFGKCNKGEGKCPFIHDPSKIAVCTKFLNGLCADSNCKLTHKVIPERMPDCSFFLQGLCSNENCPYRHVNVNPKAPICESFLRGYCAEGNECRKKHSYICPEYEATGSCPQGSKCRLYHPKKGKGGKKRKISKDERNSRGRYFGSGPTTVVEPETATKAEKIVIAPKNDRLGFEEGNWGDFISLDVDSDDEAGENYEVCSEPTALREDDETLNSQLDDLDQLIKPLRILERE